MNEEKFLDLLLEKCVNLNNSKSVFISYNIYNESLVQKLVDRLSLLYVDDIYLECIDPFYEKDLINSLSEDEIVKSKYFDKSIYDKYAKKASAFILFESPVPGLFDDVSPQKMSLVARIKTSTKSVFIKKECANEISWTIVPVYNKYWEESINVKNLGKVLNKICLLDDPINNWNKLLIKYKNLTKKINSLQLTKLHYTNSLGTDLWVGLNENYHFESIADDKVLVNMPSYEIFTSPNYLYTEGIVYSSKPLYYNGREINDFFLEFKNGKVVNFDAKKGKETLQSIIEYDKGSSFLGEVALVEKDSPISKTGIIFKTTLLDENASCHLALGQGFGKGTGINKSKIHVDFMIGTSDLNITGFIGNEEFPIMINGKFVI